MRNKTVLLVDDEKPILQTLGNYLKRNEFHVQPAINGEDALTEFSSSSYDLVITDLVMKGISGMVVLQEIKKTDNESGVFILTGHGNMTLAIEALRSGADDFILKPCDPEELVLKMTRFFEKQEAFRTIKIYEKILPICMYCEKIRDDSGTEPGKGRWLRMDEYLCQKSGKEMTHGCCPECFKVLAKNLHKPE